MKLKVAEGVCVELGEGVRVSVSVTEADVVGIGVLEADTLAVAVIILVSVTVGDSDEVADELGVLLGVGDGVGDAEGEICACNIGKPLGGMAFQTVSSSQHFPSDMQ